MRMMEEAGLLDEDPEQEATKTKLMRYQQFKNLRDFDLEKVQGLLVLVPPILGEEATSSTTSSGSVSTQSGTHVWQRSEGSLSHRVPQIVVDSLVYVEARAVQRAKPNTVRHGTFFPTTFIPWRRKLHSMIKLRLWIYKQERIEQWRQIVETYFNNNLMDHQEILKKAEEEVNPQQASEASSPQQEAEPEKGEKHERTEEETDAPLQVKEKKAKE